MYATLASRDVDCCLIPESPFHLEGPGGLFEFAERRLKENGHMVIVIAEGAGQELVSESIQSMHKQDASGNKLLQDVGLWISQKIKVWICDFWLRYPLDFSLFQTLVWLSMFETKFSVHFMNLKCCPLFLVFNFMISSWNLGELVPKNYSHLHLVYENLKKWQSWRTRGGHMIAEGFVLWQKHALLSHRQLFYNWRKIIHEDVLYRLC